MTQWGGARSPSASAPASPVIGVQHDKGKDYMRDTVESSDTLGVSTGTSTPRNGEKSTSNSRPTSMIQAVNDTNGTPPELGPIFGYINAHANKLYQEGYFLKLHDLDSRELGLEFPFIARQRITISRRPPQPGSGVE